MEWEKRKRLALYGVVISALATGLFWAGWYLHYGYVPLVEYDMLPPGRIVMLPAVSRWLDILLYPPWVGALILMITHPRAGSLKTGEVMLIFSVVTGFLLVLFRGFIMGTIICTIATILFGIIAGVFAAIAVARMDDIRVQSGLSFIAAAPFAGALMGLAMSSMIGLGVSILFGSVYGLVFTGLVGTVFGMSFFIAFTPVFGIVRLIRVLIPSKKVGDAK